MTIDAPGREDPFRESVFAGTPDVIHDFVLAIFDDCLANARSEIVEHFVPTDAFPFSFATFPNTFQRIKNSIRIVYLVERRGAFGAITSAAARILWVAFKLLNLIRVFVDV